jgi:hypothetical protein
MLSLIVGIVPIVLSFVVLAAHFLRSSDIVLVAASLIGLALLFVPRRWAARTVQLALVLAALEWVRTLVLIVQERMAYGAPYTRTAIILGAVAAFTLASVLGFRVRALRRRYQLDDPAR